MAAAFVVATIGQKGGGGKSTVARLIAVELAKQNDVVIVDVDVSQRTSTEWAAAREFNGLEPKIQVETVDPEGEPDFRIPELSGDGAGFIIVDAPGWSDRTTVELGQRADLCVLPMGCSTDDLRPGVRLYHELVGDGVEPRRILIVLNRVGTDNEVTFARNYLKSGEVPADAVLEPVLPEQTTYRDRGNGGQAATEVPHKGPRDAALKVAAAIIGKAKRLSAKPKTSRKKPLRFVAGKW